MALTAAAHHASAYCETLFCLCSCSFVSSGGKDVRLGRIRGYAPTLPNHRLLFVFLNSNRSPLRHYHIGCCYGSEAVHVAVPELIQSLFFMMPWRCIMECCDNAVVWS